MQQLQISSDIIYKVTQDFEIIPNTKDRIWFFDRETNPKFIIHIKEGLTDPGSPSYWGFYLAAIYQGNSGFENLLSKGEWQFRFLSMNLFNLNNYRNNHRGFTLVKQYKNQPPTYETRNLSLESILEVLAEFDELPEFDIYLENKRLLEENKTLKKLISELRKKISGTLKGLK